MESPKILMVYIQTVLNENQAEKRAGLTVNGHNHGEDWGTAGKIYIFSVQHG
jgi:hypothetical protein